MLPGLPVKPLVPSRDPHVQLKPSASLPVLHRPAGNLSRVGGGEGRIEMLQRQFEHAGQSHAPLTRSERTRALNVARKLHDRAVVDSLVLDALTNAPLEYAIDKEHLTVRCSSPDGLVRVNGDHASCFLYAESRGLPRADLS